MREGEEKKEAEEEERTASLINLAPGGTRGEFLDTQSCQLPPCSH